MALKLNDLDKKRRLTNQRQVLIDFLETVPYHPTAIQIFGTVKKVLPTISLGTVYRNLDVLEKEGYITSLHYGPKHARYEIFKPNHYHFCCTNCDKVEDLVMDELADLNSQIEKRHNLDVLKHSLMFYGMCKECLDFLNK